MPGYEKVDFFYPFFYVRVSKWLQNDPEGYNLQVHLRTKVIVYI